MTTTRPRAVLLDRTPDTLTHALSRLARLEGEAADLIGHYDHVTRLPNRMQFCEDFTALRSEGGRHRMLIMVTLAEARHYNEILRALGHEFAEDFVRAGAILLQAVLPPEPAVYHVSVLSFALVVNHDGEGIPPLAAEIAAAFGSDIQVNDIPIKTQVGVGLLPLEARVTGPAEALRAALTAAQDSRRTESRLAFYNNLTDAAHQRAFRLLTDLPAALQANDQLHLMFQPRIHLADGTICGAEALLRWQHPVMGNVPPGEFIPLVEQTSLIGPLTDWVMDSALTEARALRKAGRALKVSINASPANIAEEDFDAKLLDLCASHDVSPDDIEIEFTEGLVAGNTERAIRQLTSLRAAGIEIAIDDFGTGFANFSQLARVPADVLKIDQSFIRPLAPGDDFLVRHILDMAKGLGFRVCAEGIETSGSYDLLKTLGCDEGQGYFMARPMPPAELRDWHYGR